jgi:Ca2+-binding EF-hand superfamily protein
MRVGHIPVDVLAENLISLGLAINKNQVVSLIQLVSKNDTESDQIEIQEFIKIFEKNSFSERYVI